MLKFFAFVLSLQLIICPVALAQNAGDQFRENPDSKKKSSFMDQISSIAIAGVGTTALLSCTAAPLLPSIMIFNAGSLVYIASEIMGGKAQNAFQNRKISDMKMVEEKMKGKPGGEVQKEALEAALKDEKETLSIINKRKKWLGAISMVYSLATIAALLEVLKMAIPFLVPPKQFTFCNPGTSAGALLPIKAAVVAAWSFVGMQGSGGGMIGKYGQMAAALAIAFTGLGTKIIGMMKAAPTRLAAFAIATALIKKNQSDLSAQAAVAKENIEKLERVLDQFNKDSKLSGSSIQTDVAGAGQSVGGSGNGSTSAGGEIGKVSVASGLNNGALNNLPTVDDDMSKNCWKQGSVGPEYTSDCKNPLNLARPKFDAQVNIPTLINGANTAMDFAEAVGKGDIAKADASAATLSSMAGKIQDVQDDLLKKVNDDLVAQKKEPINLDTEANKLRTELQNTLDAEATSNGMDLGKMASSLLTEDPKKEESKVASINQTGENQGASSAQNALPTLSEGLTNGEGLTEGDTSNAKTLEESLDQYESAESDISKRSEDSLFDQLSHRYQKNYSRFFKKKEVTP